MDSSQIGLLLQQIRVPMNFFRTQDTKSSQPLVSSQVFSVAQSVNVSSVVACTAKVESGWHLVNKTTFLSAPNVSSSSTVSSKCFGIQFVMSCFNHHNLGHGLWCTTMTNLLHKTKTCAVVAWNSSLLLSTNLLQFGLTSSKWNDVEVLTVLTFFNSFLSLNFSAVKMPDVKFQFSEQSTSHSWTTMDISSQGMSPFSHFFVAHATIDPSLSAVSLEGGLQIICMPHSCKGFTIFHFNGDTTVPWSTQKPKWSKSLLNFLPNSKAEAIIPCNAFRLSEQSTVISFAKFGLHLCQNVIKTFLLLVWCDFNFSVLVWMKHLACPIDV